MTTLVIVGTRTEAQVGIGSESDCLSGKLRRIFEISDSVAGLKVEKLKGRHVVFLDPDFVKDAKISAIRIHLRHI